MLCCFRNINIRTFCINRISQNCGPRNGINCWIRPFHRPFIARHVSQCKSVVAKHLRPIKCYSIIKSGSLLSGGLFCVSYIIYSKGFGKRAECEVEIDEMVAQNNDQKSDLITQTSQKSQNEDFDYAKLWTFVKPDILYLTVAITSALIVGILNIQIPISLGAVMNVLSRFASEDVSLWNNQFFAEMKVPAFKVLELYLFQSVFTFLYISSLAILGEKTATRIRNELFSSIIRFDIKFFDVYKSGEIISRLTNDVQEFKSSFKLCISQGLRSITQIIGCSISLFVISPQMTLWMASIVPALVLCGACIGSCLRNMSKEAQAQVAKASGIACEAINNVRTVKAFAMEESQSKVYNKELELAEELNCNLGVGIGILQGVTNLALNGIVLGTLLYGGYLLSKEQISAGNLMSFLVATQTIQRSLSQLSIIFGQYVRGVTAGTRIFAFLDINPSVDINKGIRLHNLMGEISFKNVTFIYPTRLDHVILKDFNIKLIPGRITAICGLSGEGKSTIASLLERFYDINSGLITLDGNDIRLLDPSWLRGEVIGFINQEPILFGTTVMENIRFGKPDSTDEEVYRAAKVANAHNFIETFPDGYNTIVGERGVTVSGGQKQRIAIARAIIKNPRILILDEATSALDAESEALVQDALEKVMKGRTVLVIAHRLSTIQNADVIAVISNGKIVESGTHSELKKIRGHYWQLVSQQYDINDKTDL